MINIVTAISIILAEIAQAIQDLSTSNHVYVLAACCIHRPGSPGSRTLTQLGTCMASPILTPFSHI